MNSKRNAAAPAPQGHNSLAAELSDAVARFVAAHPESRAMHERAKAVMPGGNTRTELYYSPFPPTNTRTVDSQLNSSPTPMARRFMPLTARASRSGLAIYALPCRNQSASITPSRPIPFRLWCA